MSPARVLDQLADNYAQVFGGSVPVLPIDEPVAESLRDSAGRLSTDDAAGTVARIKDEVRTQR